VSASASFYYTMPIPLRPILALRGGGKKVFGTFPFHESAFLGGRGTVRELERQRYAGDAAVAGTMELQLPIVKFPLILPISFGVYGYGDAGRVYVDGQSPGGWHRGAGVGVWIAVLSPATALNLELGDRRGRTLVRVRTGLTF
jgi:hemolysin activation/secretion protein